VPIQALRATVTVPASISERLLQGDRAALARMISWAENGDPRFGPALEAVYPRVGRAYRIGFTGPPGAGKSTLVNEFARLVRLTGRTVGVLAVDPSSPFSGGALLGDRIRMEERTLDPGVFIRSMASRESHGGIARAAVDACDAMDAFGLDTILLETVGVGQAEYDVVGAADTVVVILCPGAGDGIQAMKAGLLEVADILVVNKSDLPGADRLARDLEETVHVRFRRESSWEVPVLEVSAGRGEGVAELLEAVERHRAHVAIELEARRLVKRRERVRQVVAETLASELWSTRGLSQSAEAALAAGRPPHAVADQLITRVLEQIPALAGDQAS
jgi:LAO/AO transport system kinase